MAYTNRDKYINLLKESLKKHMKVIRDFKPMGNGFVYTGTRTAINKTEQIPINYLCGRVWFGLIISWQYIKLPKAKKETLASFVSLPFFASKKDDDGRMIPIFRAEWDSYIQENNKHPQPHWHFTHVNSLYDVLYPDFDQVVGEWDMLLLDEYKAMMEEMPIHRMHFTMSEKWEEGEEMISAVPEPNKLALWITHLLRHVETEIKFVMNE